MSPTSAPTEPTSTGSRLPAAARLGPVELIVTDLDRTLDFYSRVIGLHSHRREGAIAAMTSGGENVLIFHEQPEARRAGSHAGLFHVALLYPTRLELSRVARRVASSGSPVTGASDHGTHEAIYLSDPDGNGLELAADRPREQWPDVSDPAAYAAGPQPLDTQDLLRLTQGEQAPERADGVAVGHVHLHVADAAAALRFYRDVVGFDEMVSLLPSAAFVSAGGYHHHVAFNVWRGSGLPPAPPDAVGMRRFTLVLPGAADVAELRRRVVDAGLELESAQGGTLLRDPSGNALLVRAE
ncbi:MAG: VOC family protein [Solirubrobacterales bacterium]|nr:VOC family protein [Solirubrobacterales bacterium]